jgi:molybdate transport system regulatory protein
MKQGDRPRLWIKLIVPGIGQIGPGKIQLLEFIERDKSISSAARGMGMSYRRAWSLVDDLNQMFGVPVVETTIGGSSRGGAKLTPFGGKLVRTFRTALKRSDRACERLLSDLVEQRRPQKRD